MQNWQRAGFGLYVHWPFCQAKCPYCDFNSHVVATVDQSRWAKALVSEIERHAALLPDRVLSSIFFGGGTPSLMRADTVADIIGAATKAWAPANDIEITLEANPTSTESARFRDYRAAGVNRVSIGVQSLRDNDLKALGRLHNVSEALAAVEIAKTTFNRMSFDLIYARQHQSLSDWEAELREALALGVDHLSLYQLTIEPGTAFGARHAAGGLKGLPGEDLGADMFDLTNDICAAHGLPAYEISNHARPDTGSRHNMIYWNSADWVGVGPGAHGRFTDDEGIRTATEGILQPGAWIGAVENSGGGNKTQETIGRQDQQLDAAFMGLRLSRGIESDNPAFPYLKDHPEITDLVAQGLVEASNETIRLSPTGRPLLNAIVGRLLP